MVTYSGKAMGDVLAVIVKVFIVSVLIFAPVFMLTGCSWIESDAGKARYTYRVITAEGTIHEIELFNAKDVGEVAATVVYGGIEVTLYEKGVSATGPMATMAEANARAIDALIGVAP